MASKTDTEVRAAKSAARFLHKPPLENAQSLPLEERKRHFLDRLAECGQITVAARYVGVARRTIYDWKERDDQFTLACADALEDHKELVSYEVFLRGFVGVEKPIRDRAGNIIDIDHLPSDNLMMFYTKKLMPEYRDSAKVTEPIEEQRYDVTFATSNGQAIEHDAEDDE